MGLEIKPYLAADVQYQVAKQDKAILVIAYSARYPYSLIEWIQPLVDDLNMIIKDGVSTKMIGG